MKITAELKGELSEWLDTYWKTYLNGDLDTWATFIKKDLYNTQVVKGHLWNCTKFNEVFPDADILPISNTELNWSHFSTLPVLPIPKKDFSIV